VYADEKTYYRRIDGVIASIKAELARAIKTHGPQTDLPVLNWVLIIAEELGEVAGEFNAAVLEKRGFTAKAVEYELTQVAAMCVKAILALNY